MPAFLMTEFSSNFLGNINIDAAVDILHQQITTRVIIRWCISPTNQTESSNG